MIRIGSYVKIQETGEVGEVTTLYTYTGGHREYDVRFEKANEAGDLGYRCPESSLSSVARPKKPKKT